MYIKDIKKIKNDLDEITIYAINKYLQGIKLNEEEDRLLKELNEKNIESQKAKISEVDISNIEIYISFFSLSETGEYEYSLLDKNLKLFENINEVYFIVTPQSKGKCEKFIKEHPNGKNLFIIEVSTDDYSEVYMQLFDRLKDYENSTMVMDNTLGPKMLGYEMYRFSIDQGIKLITWQSHQVNGTNKRIPGVENLNYIEFPQLKNSSILKKINNFLDQFKFKEASELAKIINNLEEAEIYEYIGEIFTLDNMLDFNKFNEELKDFVEIIETSKFKPLIKMKLEELKKKIKNYLKLTKDYKYINYTIILKSYFNEKLEESTILKERIVEDIILENLKKAKLNFSKDEVINILENQNVNDIIKKLLGDNLDKNKEQNFIYLKDIVEKINYIIPKTINLKDDTDTIFIDKLKLEIKEKGLSTSTVFYKKAIRELLLSDNFEISDEEFKKLLEESTAVGARNTQVSRFKENIGKLNAVIEEKISNKRFLNQNFIIFQSNSKKSDTKTKTSKDNEYKYRYETNYILKINPLFI